MPIGTLGEGQDEPRERIIIVQPMSQPQPQQIPQQMPQEQVPQKVKGPSITQRLVSNSKAKLMNFHYKMLERKRRNAMLKKRNPKAYAKMAAKRREKYDVMKTPNLFDGSGNMKW